MVILTVRYSALIDSGCERIVHWYEWYSAGTGVFFCDNKELQLSRYNANSDISNDITFSDVEKMMSQRHSKPIIEYH